ncbi:MAG TPA: phosphatase PAP2 family protein [Flavitalea sp.]|nr:phosphatase PAP2 family protein [Flavitalea sp.]
MLLLNLPGWLDKTDREVFSFIHASASSPYLDWLMMAMRNPPIWIPLYAFMLYWIIRKHKQFAWPFILLSLVGFAITDFVSASILKPFFARPRPCYDPELTAILRNLIGCGGRYGLPSSHASNHFGLAAFWFLAVSHISGKKWYWLWIWAILICYAQVYVGKHYPFDIIVGAGLGITVGCLMGFLFRRWTTKKEKDDRVVQMWGSE